MLATESNTKKVVNRSATTQKVKKHRCFADALPIKERYRGEFIKAPRGSLSEAKKYFLQFHSKNDARTTYKGICSSYNTLKKMDSQLVSESQRSELLTAMYEQWVRARKNNFNTDTKSYNKGFLHSLSIDESGVKISKKMSFKMVLSLTPRVAIKDLLSLSEKLNLVIAPFSLTKPIADYEKTDQSSAIRSILKRSEIKSYAQFALVPIEALDGIKVAEYIINFCKDNETQRIESRFYIPENSKRKWKGLLDSIEMISPLLDHQAQIKTALIKTQERLDATVSITKEVISLLQKMNRTTYKVTESLNRLETKQVYHQINTGNLDSRAQHRIEHFDTTSIQEITEALRDFSVKRSPITTFDPPNTLQLLDKAESAGLLFISPSTSLLEPEEALIGPLWGDTINTSQGDVPIFNKSKKSKLLISNTERWAAL